MIKYLLRYRLFIALVLIPSIFSIAYFGFIASDIYISESQFVIRSSDAINAAKSSSALPASMARMLGGSSNSTSPDDTQIVVNYISSSDALRALNNKFNLMQLFRDLKIDIIRRFGGITGNTSFEKFNIYYNDFIVNVEYDSERSPIINLQTRAFSARDSKSINDELLQLSESLVNQLNEKARQDLIGLTKKDIDFAEKKLRDADQKLNEYRTKMINKGGNKDFVAEYQSLDTARSNAETELASMLADFSQARINNERAKLYMQVLANPNLPDYPMEPKRFLNIISSILLYLLIWGSVKLFVVGAKQHLS